MEHLDMKELIPCHHEGTRKDKTREPESRCDGQQSRRGRATIPYTIARLFSCLHAKLFPTAASLLLLLAALPTGCVVNMEEGAPLVIPVDNSGERLVRLALTVPGIPSSRALNDTRESDVTEVDLLLFDANDDFYYRAIGADVHDDDVDEKMTKHFTAKLPVGAWTVVILANARAIINASAHAASLAPGTAATAPLLSRAEVLGSLRTEIAVATEWSALIPMWGYYKYFDAVDNAWKTTLDVSATTNAVTGISLTRAVARVDVEVIAPASDHFDMEKIYLYNRNRAGALAPPAGAATVNDGYRPAYWDGGKAIAPNLPASPLPEEGPLEFTVAPDPHAFHHGIYLHESAAGTPADPG
ncbi:MAG: FimB/Mfa2 family fimbrial subunit [Odoribacteraceae bacterium]|jgi:hypothetical protein|nr:FimB/Mfa2 family fimbrial subunit [Odoribacteraceae bacterium]